MKSTYIFAAKILALLILWLVLEYIHFFESSGLNNIVIHNLISLSKFIFGIGGYDLFIEDYSIGITGSTGVIIGPPCNALDLMALFIGILILLPGNLKSKIIYGFLGTVLIHILNLSRVVFLILLANFAPSSLEFNHSYTFTIIMYVIIFGIWVLYSKRFSQKDSSP